MNKEKNKQHNWKEKLLFGAVMTFATLATLMAMLFIIPVKDSADEEQKQYVIDVIRKKAKTSHPVETGLQNLCKQLSGSKRFFFTGDGVEEQINDLIADEMNLQYSLNFSNAPSLEGKTVGADGTFMRSIKEKQMYLHTDVSISRIEMLSADIYGKDKEMYLCFPEITEDDSISLQTEDIDRQFNESRLSYHLNKTIPQPLSIYPYQSYNIQMPEELWIANFLANVFNGVGEDEDNKKGNAYEIPIHEIETVDTKETITIGENQLKLRTYQVTLENAECAFEIALDKNKDVRVIRFPKDFEYKSVKFKEGTICFTGEEKFTDIVEIDVEFIYSASDKESKKAEELLVNLEMQITDILSVDMNMEEGNREFSLAAKIQEATDGGLETDIDYFTIKESGKDVIKITGAVSVNGHIEEIPINAGEPVDLLHMNDMELFMTLMPWADNFEKRYGGMMELLK